MLNSNLNEKDENNMNASRLGQLSMKKISSEYDAMKQSKRNQFQYGAIRNNYIDQNNHKLKRLNSYQEY